NAQLFVAVDLIAHVIQEVCAQAAIGTFKITKHRERHLGVRLPAAGGISNIDLFAFEQSKALEQSPLKIGLSLAGLQTTSDHAHGKRRSYAALVDGTAGQRCRLAARATTIVCQAQQSLLQG